MMTATVTKADVADAIARQKIVMPPVDIDAHERRRAEIFAKQKANREEMLKCCDPAYARQKELEKPVYQWRVQAAWYAVADGRITKFEGDETVIAQNEADAWAMFAHVIGITKSRSESDVTITRGKRVPIEEALSTQGGGEEAIPTKLVGRKAKAKNLG